MESDDGTVDGWAAAIDDLPSSWALTPVKGKKPYRPRWSEEPPVDRRLIVEEIESGHASGVGLRTGPISGGVFAVDEDGPHSLELLQATPRRLPPTVSVTSGRRGHRQRFFSVPEKKWPGIRNRTVFIDPARTAGSKLALRFGSMESCLPPSLHPDSRRYRWGPGPRPHEIDDSLAPEWLLRHAEYEPGEANSIVDAAWRGDLELVAGALQRGISADSRARDGHTALQRAVWGGHYGCTNLLLAAGADPALPDPQGVTPLMLAAALGHTNEVGALLDAGAAVSRRDGTGRTPLHEACWGGHAEVAEALLAAGADRDARDNAGAVPADEARRWRHEDLIRACTTRATRIVGG